MSKLSPSTEQLVTQKKVQIQNSFIFQWREIPSSLPTCTWSSPPFACPRCRNDDRTFRLPRTPTTSSCLQMQITWRPVHTKFRLTASTTTELQHTQKWSHRGCGLGLNSQRTLRSHNKPLITESTQLNDRDFLIRSIYKDPYWLKPSNHICLYLTVIKAYIHLYILALFVNCHSTRNDCIFNHRLRAPLLSRTVHIQCCIVNWLHLSTFIKENDDDDASNTVTTL